MQDLIEVMLVDDSAAIRGAMRRGLEADPAIRIVGCAHNGLAALELLQELNPAIVVLDVEMPVMDGLDALPKIRAARPGITVIMASALTRRHAAMSFKALELGAADYVPKPEAAAGAPGLAVFFEELKAKIKAHARARTLSGVSAPRAAPRAVCGLARTRPAAIAIGSSTGGPPALLKIFTRAKGRVNVPVFITQHMPATFTAILAEQLAHVSGAPAVEGVDGAIVRPGAIFVAPGGRHMLAERAGGEIVIRLSDGVAENFCKPAVDPMFRALAQVYGAGLLAAVLTGMGRDGADGAIAVAEAGGRFITQDEATSVVYGMPGAAFRTGRAMAELPLDDAATYLVDAMAGA